MTTRATNRSVAPKTIGFIDFGFNDRTDMIAILMVILQYEDGRAYKDTYLIPSRMYKKNEFFPLTRI